MKSSDGTLIDVVFLHGLNGDARRTWMHDTDPGSFWPQWLGEDVPDAAVWTVDYDAWSTRYRGDSMWIKDRAMNLMAQLRNKRLGDRPLCFVAHSMGGLLVKEILMHAAQGRTEFRTFAAQTRGVVFLATPHTGSDLATALHALRWSARTTPAVRELRREEVQLRYLSDDYRNWVAESGVQHAVFHETRRTRKFFVVQPSSANPGLPGVPSIPVDANHGDICKPLNRDAAVYAGVRRFVESLVAEVSRPPPAQLPAFVPRPIHGREEILGKVRAALARSGTALVELNGPYGIGKTAIATELARAVAPEAHPVYLSARGFPGATVSSVLAALAASVAGHRERQRLADRLLAPEMDMLAKLDAILDRLGTDRVLVIVDDAQELRGAYGARSDNAVGELRDKGLANLLEATIRRPGHRVQFLFVTAEPVLRRGHPREPVQHGLAAEPFGEFLRDLEAPGEVGLQVMPAGELEAALRGHPRTTELIYGIRAGSTTPVRELASLAGDPERLDRALLDSLDDLDRKTLRALAVFGRPVVAAAVSDLIGAPAGAVRGALDRLSGRRIARRRYDRFELPSDDARRLTERIPAAELAALRRRAAEHFEAAARLRTPRHVADLVDAFDAVDLHLLAGNAPHALTLLRDLDENHLKNWGQTGMLAPWLSRLAEALPEPYDQVLNASLMARALAQQGDLAAGIAMTRTALELNDSLGITDVQLRLLVQMAGYFFQLGHVREAAADYEKVLELAGPGQPMVADAHLGVALCRMETGHFADARTALGRAESAAPDDRLTGARIRFARAGIAYELGEHHRCRQELRAARAIGAAEGADVLAGRCDDLMARVAWYRDDFPEAESMAERARDAAERTGHPGLNRGARITLAILYLTHGDFERAGAAATAATRFDRSPLVAEAFALRGVALVRTEARDLAAEAFTEADRLVSELLTREPRRYLVREVQGLALAGLRLLDRAPNEELALSAYGMALLRPDVPGARHRCRALFRTLVAGRPDDPLPRLRRILAE